MKTFSISSSNFALSETSVSTAPHAKKSSRHLNRKNCCFVQYLGRASIAYPKQVNRTQSKRLVLRAVVISSSTHAQPTSLLDSWLIKNNVSTLVARPDWKKREKLNRRIFSHPLPSSEIFWGSDHRSFSARSIIRRGTKKTQVVTLILLSQTIQSSSISRHSNICFTQNKISCMLQDN